MQSTLAKLSLCRTAALGGRRYRCDGCQHECVLYNSCGDRHCPQCSGAKRADWIDSTEKLLLRGVDYFQVVFTLPSELSRLALGNRKQLYDLLFSSAWRALKETIKSEQGYDPAALMVLHTWNQRLDAHAHVHAVVPGGGPRLDGKGWTTCRRRNVPNRRCAPYLVDAIALRRCYRKHFLAGLQRLRTRDELKLDGDFKPLKDDEPWAALIAKLQATEWVSYIEPPPSESCRAEHVLKYLARYLTGGPISDGRIVAADENQVTFWAREGKTTGGDKTCVPVTIPIEEFTRRWSLHILPKGYTKTRRFGGWSNRRRDQYVERGAVLLEAAEAPLPIDATDFGPFDNPDASLCDVDDCESCPRCGGRLRQIADGVKPSWGEVLNSSSRPNWYARDSLKQAKPCVRNRRANRICKR